MRRTIPSRSGVLILILAFSISPAIAQKSYDPGATDTEIKVGNFAPYTGMFSQYGVNGIAEAAYFRMINDKGGINGRHINFISLDSNSDTGKALALARQLVEQDQVLLTVGIWGTPTNLAIRSYLNEKKVPQLFVSAPDSRFDDPSHFPWTMGFQASKRTEGRDYADYILKTRPAAKIAILYAADESGTEWLLGIHDGLGDRSAKMIVKELPFEYSEPAALDAKVTALKETGADVFMNMTVGRYATEAIRVAYDIGWHPLQFIPNASLSIAAFLDPAGLKRARGIISNARSKSWSGAEARKDPAVRAFLDWMRTYNPTGSLRDAENVYGYEVAEALVEVLKKCGDNLTRANVMKQASNLNLEISMLRPGIKITTSPHDYQPIKQLYLVRFDGQHWRPISE
jgi:branched-chain amino acid transport system substrate-binding protein